MEEVKRFNTASAMPEPFTLIEVRGREYYRSRFGIRMSASSENSEIQGQPISLDIIEDLPCLSVS